MARSRLIALAGGLSAALGLAIAGHGAYLYAKATLAQHLLSNAWASALDSGAPVRPWPWADAQAVARLSLPGHRPLVVLSNADGSALAFAPGHLASSAAPGLPGHSVISAHRDTHFRGLNNLRTGDRLVLERLDRVQVHYEVLTTEIMHSERHRLRRLDTQDPWLTLITCYPFDAVRPGGPWRFLVHARAIDADDPLPVHSTTLQSIRNPSPIVGF